MKLLILAVVACLAVSDPAFGQQLTPGQIEAAIEAGQTGEQDQLVSRCTATASALDRLSLNEDLHPDTEHFHVRVFLTGWRIALLSAEARRLYKPYPASHVPENLQTLAVYVEAIPHDSRSAVIEHVVLKAKNRNNVVKPNNVRNVLDVVGLYDVVPVLGLEDDVLDNGRSRIVGDRLDIDDKRPQVLRDVRRR